MTIFFADLSERIQLAQVLESGREKQAVQSVDVILLMKQLFEQKA
jgi:hypothetical protein